MELSLFPQWSEAGVALQVFKRSPLGQLHASIPFKALADSFRAYLPQHPQGRKALFSVEGALGLMFLKHYHQFSDRLLVERLNSDRHLQLFCGIWLKPAEVIRDIDLPGRWRRFFARHLDIAQLQAKLRVHWKPHMHHTQVLLDDATCYESAIKYPTDVKLLYDCTEWL